MRAYSTRRIPPSPVAALVIDGIRHAEAVDALRQLVTPSELVLVFITVNNAVREARLRQRGVTDREQLRRAEAHPIEVQARTVLPEMADLTVDGARPVEDLLQEMVTWIRQHEVGQRRRLFADPAREIPHGRASPGDGRLR